MHVTLRNGQKYKIGRILDVSPQAFPSPPWICGRAQHRSAPCTCAESSVPSRTCTPSAPRRCAPGKERQSRSVERATGPTPPSSTTPPWLTPSRPCLRGFQATQSSRTSGHKGMPVCAAVGGPVSAASLKRTLRGWTAPALRWAARQCSGPPSARQRARTDAAPYLSSPPPQGSTAVGTGAAALCPCTASSHPQHPRTGALPIASLLDVGGYAAAALGRNRARYLTVRFSIPLV